MYRSLRKPCTQKGDALLLDLGLGLVTVAAFVLWASISLKLVF